MCGWIYAVTESNCIHLCIYITYIYVSIYHTAMNENYYTGSGNFLHTDTYNVINVNVMLLTDKIGHTGPHNLLCTRPSPPCVYIDS